LARSISRSTVDVDPSTVAITTTSSSAASRWRLDSVGGAVLGLVHHDLLLDAQRLVPCGRDRGCASDLGTTWTICGTQP